MGKGRMRLGAFGGTFDPIHHGHLLMAREAVRVLGLDSVLFVPIGEPGHRNASEVSPPADRCAMVNAALASTRNDRFALSTVDIERGTPTYTIDTVRELHACYGATSDLYFLVGSDRLAEALRWHRSAEILQLASFIATSRLGYPLVDPGFPRGRLTLVRVPVLGISSTRIRQCVRRGQPIDTLTPPAVAAYIRDQRLYVREAAASDPTSSARSSAAASAAQPARRSSLTV